MRRKRENGGLFIIFVVVAIAIAVALMMVLPASVKEWKQLIFFLTIIVVTTLELIIYKRVKR